VSRRQRQILEMIARGMSSEQIAKRLSIATGTAISHRRELMRKLDLHSAAEVTLFAIKQKLIDD
jgi:DNA-binding NarL/FixJ family response regulator